MNQKPLYQDKQREKSKLLVKRHLSLITIPSVVGLSGDNQLNKKLGIRLLDLPLIKKEQTKTISVWEIEF